MGGLALAQRRNDAVISDAMLTKVVTAGPQQLPDAAKLDLVVATIALKYTQSNSVVYARHGQVTDP